jgi:hypothetical protein
MEILKWLLPVALSFLFGECFARRGGIDLPGDIFYLDLDEVRGIVEGDPPGVTYY